jgi:hypothetical protein
LPLVQNRDDSNRCSGGPITAVSAARPMARSPRRHNAGSSILWCSEDNAQRTNILGLAIIAILFAPLATFAQDPRESNTLELWWGPRLGLPLGDLTSATDAPAAVTDPAGYVLNADGTKRTSPPGVINLPRAHCRVLDYQPVAIKADAEAAAGSRCRQYPPSDSVLTV